MSLKRLKLYLRWTSYYRTIRNTHLFFIMGANLVIRWYIGLKFCYQIILRFFIWRVPAFNVIRTRFNWRTSCISAGEKYHGSLVGNNYGGHPHHHSNHDITFNINKCSEYHGGTKSLIFSVAMNLANRISPCIYDTIMYRIGSGHRGHSVYGLSKWDKGLLCNAFSHWQGPYTEWYLEQQHDFPYLEYFHEAFLYSALQWLVYLIGYIFHCAHSTA